MAEPIKITDKTCAVLAELLRTPDEARTSASVAKACGFPPLTAAQLLSRLIAHGLASNSGTGVARTYHLNPTRIDDARDLVRNRLTEPPAPRRPAPNEGRPMALAGGVEVWTVADLEAAAHQGRVPPGLVDTARRAARGR